MKTRFFVKGGRRTGYTYRAKVISTLVAPVTVGPDAEKLLEQLSSEIDKAMMKCEQVMLQAQVAEKVQELAEDFYYGHINEAEFRAAMLTHCS